MKTRWMRLIRAGSLVLLVIGLAACATGGPWLPSAEPTPYPPLGFAHQASSKAVELFWNCSSPAPGMLLLEGMAFNPWSGSEIRYLEFDLVGVDSRGYTVSDVSGAAGDLIFGMMRSTPFQLALPTTGSEVRFDLFYQYQYQEPGEGGGGDNKNSLLEGAPSVRLVSSTPFTQGPGAEQFMVRDACSATLHRAR